MSWILISLAFAIRCVVCERHATSVLIASNARADSASHVIAREVVDQKTIPENDVIHSLAADDIMNVREVLLMARGVSVATILADENPQIVNRDSVIAALDSAFATPVADIVIYYTGHGRKSDGAWCFAALSDPGQTEFISFDDVVAAWTRRLPQKGSPRQLYIIMDSSNSGSWVAKAHQRSAMRVGFADIMVQASSREGEQSAVSAQGHGIFTMAWIRANHNVLDDLVSGKWWWLSWLVTRSSFMSSMVSSLMRRHRINHGHEKHKAVTAPDTNVPEVPEMTDRLGIFITTLFPWSIGGTFVARHVDKAFDATAIDRPRLAEVGASYLSFFNDWASMEAAAIGISQPFSPRKRLSEL